MKKSWFTTVEPKDVINGKPLLRDMEQEDIISDFEKAEFFLIFNDSYQNWIKEFLTSQDLTKDNIYSIFTEQSVKWISLINSSCFDAKSTTGILYQARTFMTSVGIEIKVQEMINMNYVVEEKSERESEFEKMNKSLTKYMKDDLEERNKLYETFLNNI